MRNALIVDDQPYIRTIVENLLAEEGIKTLAHASDGVQALALARKLEPELIVMEIAVTGLDGIEVISRIKQLGFDTDILVLTSYPAEYSAERCMKAGAAGFLTKTHQPEDFRQAVRTLVSGYIFFPKPFLGQVTPALGGPTEQERIARLSARELAVLRYLAMGFTNIQIGEALLLSNKTVSSYKSRLVAKLKVDSLVCLADLARRHHLV
ncbi:MULTISPECIES: response regulator transcription factor [Pseudomonas]|uniref:Response regulator transcription factor n=1 Tax=Pseudomonas quercus TaxID=2722792 RepID=A0ABX0YFD8_9PSED|nr:MULTISPECIES: response regulator transcription factor [Pseudomonas]MBF7142205.1 response regulator transcription factor [Pseudomonas sp. LY10J]NJP00743.1 response regulator transcription factor [Pseudomonas quercus]